MFTAEQRTKEIGIRKVLGASISSILQLLSADLFKLVLIAVLIASPIAWWAMNVWLNDYAYKIDINWWMFLLAGRLVILIAGFYSKLPGNKSSDSKPGEEFESGVNNF